MRTVVLIRPDIDPDYPFGKLPPYLPIGLASVAGVLEQDNYQVKIIDCYLDGKKPDDVLAQVKKYDPIFIGISVNIACVKNASNLSIKFKENTFFVVVGGPQVTVYPKDTLSATGADIGVIGEGEITMREVARCLLEKKDFRGINGIVYKEKDGIKITGQREPLDNLDVLPFMPLELFPHKKYAQDTPELSKRPFGWMSTSRGCPWDCGFCSNIHVWGRKYRAMSPERVVSEILHLNRNFGIKALEFREDNFTADRERVVGICRLLKQKKVEIEWMCESRVDLVDDGLLSQMYSAGCRAIYFGIESGSQRVLDFLNKGFKVEHAEKAVKLCAKNKIRVIASVMIGVPTQTKEENESTVTFLKRLSPDVVYFNAFVGIPGSKMYDYIVENKLIFKKSGGIILANSEYLTWPEKLALKHRYEISYNLSPKIFLRHLRRMGLARFLRKGVLTLIRFIRSRRT